MPTILKVFPLALLAFSFLLQFLQDRDWCPFPAIIEIMRYSNLVVLGAIAVLILLS